MSILSTTLFRAGMAVFILSTFVRGQVYGQSFGVSEISSLFVNDNDYDSLIKTVAFPLAQRNKVTNQEFQTHYASNRYRFIEALQPLLQSRFSTLDEKYEGSTIARSTPAYAKARLTYLNLAREVIQTTVNGTNLFSVLFFKDYSDRILSFQVDITVRDNGNIAVSELITIFNGDGQAGYDIEGDASPFVNNDIKQGITRDFPTAYVDTNGFWSTVGFEVKGVFKNDEAEPYSIESSTYDKRIRIGTKGVFLPQGTYKYKIDYETNRQLIFHPDKDELYWNVTGNGWVFTIDSASCTIHFPPGAVIKEQACYTGSRGSTDRNCEFRLVDNHSIVFSTTKLLDSYEGLTIAASIQKGILLPPSRTDNLIAFFKANYAIPVLSLALVGLFLLYFTIWYLKGRDPKEGVIYPRFSPPAGLTPADVGYVKDQRFGPHLFAATLVDLAVKKHIEIVVKQERNIMESPVYYLNRPADKEQDPDPDIVENYGFNISRLYGLVINRSTYNTNLKTCYDNLKETLKERFLVRRGKSNSKDGLFTLNKTYIRIGAFIVIGCFFLGIIFSILHPSRQLFVIVILMLVALIILHIFFARIISAYTSKGREIVDHILGFRMYLDQAEQSAYGKLNPPEKTIELFEKYLPYAIALKVENSWAGKFDNIMQSAVVGGYQPTYYLGGPALFNIYSMSHGISSGLSTSVSQASTPPSSSSGGSSGGGSSGGGGGGGGGGGW